MKQLLVSFSLLLANPAIALANGDHTEGEEHVEEVAETGNNLVNFSPFKYIGEGDLLAALVSIILWIALIYAIYSLIKQLAKK